MFKPFKSFNRFAPFKTLKCSDRDGELVTASRSFFIEKPTARMLEAVRTANYSCKTKYHARDRKRSIVCE